MAGRREDLKRCLPNLANVHLCAVAGNPDIDPMDADPHISQGSLYTNPVVHYSQKGEKHWISRGEHSRGEHWKETIAVKRCLTMKTYLFIVLLSVINTTLKSFLFLFLFCFFANTWILERQISGCEWEKIWKIWQKNIYWYMYQNLK